MERRFKCSHATQKMSALLDREQHMSSMCVPHACAQIMLLPLPVWGSGTNKKPELSRCCGNPLCVLDYSCVGLGGCRCPRLRAAVSS